MFLVYPMGSSTKLTLLIPLPHRPPHPLHHMVLLALGQMVYLLRLYPDSLIHICSYLDFHWDKLSLHLFPLFSSVQFSRSLVSDSLRSRELQHARPLCPSPTPGVHPNPCPLSQWCHPTISSYVIPFSSYPQSFPASVSFPMSQLFASGGQSIGVWASTSVLSMNTRTDLL